MSVRNNVTSVPLVKMLELNLEDLCLHIVNEICAFTALEVQEEGERRREINPCPSLSGSFSCKGLQCWSQICS